MSTVTSSSGRRSRRSVDSAEAGARADAGNGVYLLALLLLSLFAWAPLLYPGYLQVHSGFLPVFNLADLAASPNKLTWLPTIGVTPDLLRGEGPLAYWLALLLRPLAGDIGAVKGVFALGIIGVGLGLFAWARRDLSGVEGDSDGVGDAAANPKGLLSARAGLLAAVVAMLWPPLLATVYVRGALAETLFIGLLAWALWAVAGCRLQVASGRWQVSRLAVAVSAGALTAALFWTQAGLAVWATVLLLVWALWPGAPLRSRGLAAAAVLVGALLGGGLFALLHSGQSTAAAALDVAAHAVHPYQFFSPAWGFGASTPGWQDGLPLQLGFAALGLAALTVILGFGRGAHVSLRDGSQSRFTLHALSFAAVTALVLVLLTTTLARPLWNIELLAATVTYPWQLLALAGPLLALLAGAVVVVERRLAVLPLWAAAAALVVLSSYAYLAPRFTQVTPDAAVPAIFGAGQVTLLAGDVSPLTPNPSPLRGEGSPGAPLLAPSPSEGEGWGEGESLTATIPLTVTVAWQALQPVDFDYNVFVHAVDAAGNRVAQWDGQPQRGGEAYPMTTWPVGEIVQNSYRLELDRAAAPVQRVYIGLYNWQTGERLPVNGDDKVTLEVGP